MLRLHLHLLVSLLFSRITQKSKQLLLTKLGERLGRGVAQERGTEPTNSDQQTNAQLLCIWNDADSAAGLTDPEKCIC